MCVGFRRMAIRPLHKLRCVKKRNKKFIRHQSDRYVKVKVWILIRTHNFVRGHYRDVISLLVFCTKVLNKMIWYDSSLYGFNTCSSLTLVRRHDNIMAQFHSCCDFSPRLRLEKTKLKAPAQMLAKVYSLLLCGSH